MKKQFALILTILVICISSCQKLDNDKDVPECIENLIIDFDKNQSCENGVNVKKYTFMGNTVYVFDPGNCGADMTSEVIDSDCNTIGYLGGITGNTEINGESFSTATFEAITWEK